MTGKRKRRRIWPDLPGHMAIERPNQAWRADLTDMPLRRGFPRLAASVEPKGWPGMGRAARKALSWRVSDAIAQRSCGMVPAEPTGDAEVCTGAPEAAPERLGRPEISVRIRWRDAGTGKRTPQ